MRQAETQSWLEEVLAVTEKVLMVLPAAPHPTTPHTAGRDYAALIAGLATLGCQLRVLAADVENYSALAHQWIRHFPNADLQTFAPDRARRDALSRFRRLRRPMWDAAPAALRLQLRRELDKGYDVLHVESTDYGQLSASSSRAVLSIHRFCARDWSTDRADDIRGPISPQGLRRAIDIGAEARLLRRQMHVRTLTRELASDVRSTGARAQISVIPLSLLMDLYEFQPRRSDTVGLIGSMMWPPTRAAALRLLRDVWPRVLRQHPVAELLVAGWQADSLLGTDHPLPPGIRLLPNLGDPNLFFDQVGILAFPLPAGSGMKVKILESMALGVSVVTTPAGLEGLPEQSRLASYCADSDEEFTDALLRALTNKEERFRKAEMARALVLETCSPEIVGSRMLELYATL